MDGWMDGWIDRYFINHTIHEAISLISNEALMINKEKEKKIDISIRILFEFPPAK